MTKNRISKIRRKKKRKRNSSIPCNLDRDFANIEVYVIRSRYKRTSIGLSKCVRIYVSWDKIFILRKKKKKQEWTEVTSTLDSTF
jgi:hypothetical protein